MPEYAMLAAQGDGIGGGIMQTPAEAPPYVTFYVSVENLAATLAKAAELGATTIVPPTPIPAQARSRCSPTGEHVIGIFKTG
jgi:predicted enzyme related to lactoylglutathione lyase